MQEFFPQRPEINPTIYVYQLVGVETHKNYIKVGYTERDVKARIKEQLHTSGVEYKILYQESAVCPDGSFFYDKDVHRILKRNGFQQYNEGEDKNESNNNDTITSLLHTKWNCKYHIVLIPKYVCVNIFKQMFTNVK